MFKYMKNRICAYDLEWVPDITLARRMHGLSEEFWTEAQVLDRIFREAGATEEVPRPFIKPILSRIVSIACVFRDFRESATKPIAIWSMADANEGLMISEFLRRVGKASPQLVGWNSSGSDLPVLVQRAIVNGVQAAEFFKRPDKSWEGRDYFAGNDWHIDLMYTMSPYDRRMRPKLSEMAQACGLGGKEGIDGSDVCPMYFEGRIDEIRKYNEADAVMTYKIWLKTVYAAGFIDMDAYEYELALVIKEVEKRKEAASLFSAVV